MPHASVFVGIDVSKTQLDLAVRPGGDTPSSNDEPGITQVLEQVKAVHPMLVVLEAPPADTRFQSWERGGGPALGCGCQLATSVGTGKV
nr:hypothetical protein [Nitrosomonas nitrosa]